MAEVNDVGARILGAMSGAEQIRMLLREAGFKTLTDFAFKIGTHSQTVSFCIQGDRPYPEIRDQIASVLGLDRTEIDRMIDGQKGEAAKEVA
jgi:lambda repressor-like predicted transcriptional regulator